MSAAEDRPVLLVTGGSRGIGAAVCRKAAGSGWSVAVNYASNRAAAEGVVGEINGQGGRAVAVRRMSTRYGHPGGVIVNVSSMAAVLGSGGQYVDYAASKGAIDTFTIGLSREVAQEGIRVNAIRPGVIDTDLHASGGLPDRARQLASSIPLQRPGTADEVADAILYLLSPSASYVTGAILNVSGGR